MGRRKETEQDDTINGAYAVSLDDISISFTKVYAHDYVGNKVRRQLDKVILRDEGKAMGGWVTVVFLFQIRDRGDDEWEKPRIAIERWYKRGIYWYKHNRGGVKMTPAVCEQFIRAVAKWGIGPLAGLQQAS